MICNINKSFSSGVGIDIWVELSLKIDTDILSIDWAGASETEPLIYAFGVECVAAPGQHLHLASNFIALHAYAALGMLLQLFFYLVFLRSKDFIEKMQ